MTPPRDPGHSKMGFKEIILRGSAEEEEDYLETHPAVTCILLWCHWHGGLPVKGQLGAALWPRGGRTFSANGKL